jgi:catechol 2,3-dioxygenase-like lactoylglutathione lyase family enzyme
MTAILSHVTLGVRDIARAAAFYDAVLGELAITRDKSGDGFAGWGSPHAGGFFVTRPLDGKPASAGGAWERAAPIPDTPKRGRCRTCSSALALTASM